LINRDALQPIERVILDICKEVCEEAKELTTTQLPEPTNEELRDMVPQFNIDKILNLNRDRHYREYVKESVKRSMGAGSVERSMATS
jgi:hypothetical protein